MDFLITSCLLIIDLDCFPLMDSLEGANWRDLIAVLLGAGNFEVSRLSIVSIDVSIEKVHVLFSIFGVLRNGFLSVFSAS